MLPAPVFRASVPWWVKSAECCPFVPVAALYLFLHTFWEVCLFFFLTDTRTVAITVLQLFWFISDSLRNVLEPAVCFSGPQWGRSPYRKACTQLLPWQEDRWRKEAVPALSPQKNMAGWPQDDVLKWEKEACKGVVQKHGLGANRTLDWWEG